MNRILVTGGAGFLGSNLCHKLLEDSNNYVICMDNLFTGKMFNINDLMTNKNFEFINHDVCVPIDIKCNQIYNAACPASPVAYQKSPTNTTKTCIMGIINMLELATKNKATILQFSTSEIYGNPTIHPQIESYWGNVNPNGIRSCYDEGKRAAESLCFDYHREFNTKIKVIRIFNTYGPHMASDDGRVVSNFIVNALQNKNIEIYGTGDQTRSFCFVDDLINAIIKMMNSDSDFIGPVNLGNPIENNMHELANLIIKLTKSKSKVILKPLPKDDPTRRKPDISLAIDKLKWSPEINLEVGLEKTIDYFNSILKDDNNEKEKAN